ncbi:phosphoethanolamine transferase [Tepidimonas sp. HKU77]|uniref:phosphoethanolamine transferase n=1 Tax=Tepidimonas sp. HKU77 TaxID=3414503 RepID=UPI003C7C09C9
MTVPALTLMTATADAQPKAALGWHPAVALAVLAVWLAVPGNVSLWMAVWDHTAALGMRAWWVMLAWAVALVGVNLAVLALLAAGPVRRPLGLVFIILVAIPSYFMLAYGVVIDGAMVTNVLETDLRESADLLAPALGVVVVGGVLLPGWLWWRLPWRPWPWRRALAWRAAFAVGGLVLAGLALWLTFADLASLMRNDRGLRYRINPYNTIYGVVHYAAGRLPAAGASTPLLPVGADVQPLPAAPRADEAPLVLLVVGETARAANVSLGGYPRPTMPRLAALQARGELVYFAQTTSCGTDTATSVPCLFSPDGRDARTPPQRQENLLDVWQRAGLAVTWLDNQSGCKGVCNRVPTRRTDRLGLPDLCRGDECWDEVLLRELPSSLAALDPARRRVGTVAVLHMMGSHGPAYYKRTPPAFKPFRPECTNNQLQACDRQAIVNAYDNTLYYTDHVLAELVEWLRARPGPTALWYVSDHGESLGEGGVYLHGMPYALAPREQTHVPMLVWANDAMRERLGLSWECLQRRAVKPASHDDVFHTLLGVWDIRTHAYRSERDLLRTCRS